MFERRGGFKDLGLKFCQEIPTKPKSCLDLECFFGFLFLCHGLHIAAFGCLFADERTDRLYLLEFVALSRSDLASLQRYQS